MRVRDLVGRKAAPVITVRRDEDVAAAARLMAGHGIGGLPVVDDRGAVLGIVAEGDIVRAVHEHPDRVQQVRVGDIMKKAPVCSEDTPLQDVMSQMTRERARHVLVLDDGRAAAVVSVGDLVKYRLEQLETEAGVLRDYVAAQRASS
jgi:CBS domain-containing protein